MDILGVDIGGSGIKGAVVDTLTGELKTERIRMTVFFIIISLRNHSIAFLRGMSSWQTKSILIILFSSSKAVHRHDMRTF